DNERTNIKGPPNAVGIGRLPAPLPEEACQPGGDPVAQQENGGGNRPSDRDRDDGAAGNAPDLASGAVCDRRDHLAPEPRLRAASVVFLEDVADERLFARSEPVQQDDGERWGLFHLVPP